jgi:hypothetical protein
VKTILVRVEELDAERAEYPVKLLVADGDGWSEEATSAIAAQLAAPEDLGLQAGQSLIDTIQALMIAQGTESSPAFQLIGEYLHGLLFSGDVGTKWKELVAAYPGLQGQDGRRLLLEIRSGDLNRLPWELMQSEEDPLPLFLDQNNPAARVSDFRSQKELGHCPFRRVLVLVGADPQDKYVRRDAELDELHDAFRRVYGLVDLEILDRPTKEVLRARLTTFQPHVFHFIGHGDSKERGRLHVAGPNGGPGFAWTARTIALALNAWQPRLAVINACRSEHAAESQKGTWRVGETFLRSGVPAVLGMQGDIRGDAAAKLTGALYREVARGRTIDVALAIAREEMADSVGFDRRDPWLPCLTLSVAPEHILPPQFAVTPKERDDIVTRYAPLTSFVDRVEERRDVWERHGERKPEALGAALVLLGPLRVGKTGLVKWVLGACALAAENVAYVDLGGRRRRNFRAVLAAIDEQLRAAPVHGKDNAAAMQAFVREVGIGWDTRPEGDVDPIALFEAFHGALRRIESGVIIALDHVENVEDAHRTVVRENLVKPAARGEVPVKLILAADQSAATDLLPPEVEVAVPRIQLKAIPLRDYRELAMRYLRAKGYKRDDFAPAVDFFAGRKEATQAEWLAGELEDLERVVGANATPETW